MMNPYQRFPTHGHGPVPYRTQRINNLDCFVLFIWNWMMLYFEKLPDSLCYIHQTLFVTSHCWGTFFIRFRKHHSFTDGYIVRSCCIYLPHVNGWSLKLLDDTKQVQGAKKCWELLIYMFLLFNYWRFYNFFSAKHQNIFSGAWLQSFSIRNKMMQLNTLFLVSLFKVFFFFF